ncbi:MAG TPA: hypothetical protein VGO52_23840 [Hyphomonadaceae bacterium]|jgi:hypothetical protein|nr:hypothetical protein [Hyphomonadaceae bacterium]
MVEVKRRKVRGSRTGRPIMALLDLLGRRWTLRVIWELRGEPMHPSYIQHNPAVATGAEALKTFFGSRPPREISPTIANLVHCR